LAYWPFFKHHVRGEVAEHGSYQLYFYKKFKITFSQVVVNSTS
jgi:hypothetical protein